MRIRAPTGPLPSPDADRSDDQDGDKDTDSLAHRQPWLLARPAAIPGSAREIEAESKKEGGSDGRFEQVDELALLPLRARVSLTWWS